MNKIITICLLSLFTFAVNAQAQTSDVAVKQQNTTTVVAGAEPYGKVTMQEMELKECDFEKDAIAEILFDKANITSEGILTEERHMRFKIFKDIATSLGSRRIEYTSLNESVVVTDLQGETFNLENGKIVVSQLDKSQAYVEKVDKLNSALVFALPNVKAGSVFEFKYRVAFRSFPTWYFQAFIPTRYSEVKVDLPINVDFRAIPHVRQPFQKSEGESTAYTQFKSMAYIHSMPEEQFTGAWNENLQRIEFMGLMRGAGTWPQVGENLGKFPDVGLQFERGLSGEGAIIKQAKSLKTADEKIAYIFDTVRNRMKWNDLRLWYTIDGTSSAWDKKLGNSAEINIMVYHLLKKAGINAYPMVVSTKKHAKLNPSNPEPFKMNDLVVYIPIDSTKNYVLDASGKFNLYNTIPPEELNTFGLSMDDANKDYKMVFLENNEPAMQSVFLKADIKPDGKIEGNAEITSYAYNKSNALEKYTKDGEAKYIKYLTNADNNLKVSSLKMENMETDSLPLTQKVDFKMDLTGSDETYIYFSPNLFNLLGANPFMGENRYSDIDFGYLDNYAISGIYKLPAGFKTDALPKNVTILTPDKSVIFKRIVAEENGSVLVRYMIYHKKTLYFIDDYQDLRGFYKKMYELMAEQIILKKG